MSKSEALRVTFSRPSLRRSVAVALLVGTILNLINQGDAYWSGSSLVWWKVVLTYFVPFAVASYGSYFALRAASVKHRQVSSGS